MKFSYLFLAFIISVIAFEAIGWPYKIRFIQSDLNYYVYSIICFSIPISLFLVAVFGKRLAVKLTCFIMSFAIGVPAIFIGIFSLWEAEAVSERGKDYSFEKIDDLKVEVANYRLYVADCGATCSHDLVLQKEIDLSFGVKLTSKLWTKLNVREASLSYDGNRLLIHSEGNLLGKVPL